MARLTARYRAMAVLLACACALLAGPAAAQSLRVQGFRARCLDIDRRAGVSVVGTARRDARGVVRVRATIATNCDSRLRLEPSLSGDTLTLVIEGVDRGVRCTCPYRTRFRIQGVPETVSRLVFREPGERGVTGEISLD